MKDFIEISLLAFAGTIAVKTNQWLLGQGIDPFVCIVVAVAIAVVANRGLLYLLLQVPMRFAWARPFLDPRAKAEGLWIQTIDNLDDHKHSLIFVWYNPQAKNFIMKGNNFARNGIEKGNWSSLLLEIDVAKDKIIYPYSGTHQRLESQTVFGFGIADLFRDSGIRYSRGNGQFIDAEKKATPYTFSMRRVTPREVKSLIGVKSPLTLEQCASLVRAIDPSYVAPASTDRTVVAATSA